MKRQSMVSLWNSLRFKISLGISLITIVLIGLLIINNLYAINIVRKQVALSYQNTISLYMDQIDGGLQDVDQYLLTLQINDNDLKTIENNKSADQIIFAKAHLQTTLATSLVINNYVESFFVYSSAANDLIDVFKVESKYVEREAIRDYIKSYLAGYESQYLPVSSEWFVQKIQSNYYLFHFYRNGQMYIGAWVNMGILQRPLSEKSAAGYSDIFFTTESGEPMKDFLSTSDQGIDFTKIQEGYYISGGAEKYLIIGKHSNTGNFNLVAMVPDQKILEDLPLWIRYALLIVLGFIVLLPGFFIFLRQIVINPLSKMTEAIQKFGQGDSKIRISDTGNSSEFAQLYQSFNVMASQIEDLKIKVYEEEISKQKIELQHLQLQINPHFFMNSLNLIYSYAKSGNFKLIQEMTLCLVRYFRYMFRSNLTLIPLSDELDHVQNYIRIQEIRFPHKLHFHLKVKEILLDTRIPPLLIHTFIENVIIHEMSSKKVIDINVEIELDETGIDPYLLIKVVDTGKGFEDKVLSQLKAGTRIIDVQGEHIGIWNVVQRLRLIYGEKATIYFENAVSGGAQICIKLPILIPEETDNERTLG